MLALLTWLLGTVLLGYIIVHDHLWKIGLAALTDTAFILWVVGGAASIAARMRKPGVTSKQALEWAKAVHEAQRREEAARKERESVGK